jgi:hypothetical protein
MRSLAIGIEHPLDVAIECPHHADARKHSRAAKRHHQDQGFHRALPFRRFVFCLRQLRDVIAGVLERYELATATVSDRQTVVSNHDQPLDIKICSIAA